MKILIVSYFFPPLNSVASLRPHSLAKSFAQAGHTVTVLTAAKPTNALDLTTAPGDYEVREISSGLIQWLYRVLRINAGPSKAGASSTERSNWLQSLNRWRTRRGLLLLGRMPDILDLLIRPSIRAVENEAWDLVLSTYAPRYCHAIAFNLKKRGIARVWIADFRDLWTKHHQFKGLYPFTLIEQRLESKYLATADLISTVSEPLASSLREQAPGQEVHVMPNGYDPDDLLQLTPEPYFSNNKINLVYTGTTYPRWGSFRHFLTALAKQKQKTPNLHRRLQVVFAGADVANLQARSEDLGLNDVVIFAGRLSRDDALRMQRDAHVQLFFDPNHGEGIATGKLYEYLSSGTYCWRIGPDNPTVGTEIFARTGTGEDLGIDPERIGEAIQQLLAEGTRPEFKVNNAELEQYQRGYIARGLLQKLEVLAPANG